MDKLTPRPVGHVAWPKTGGLEYGVRAEDIKVYLRCREDSMVFSYIVTPFYAGGTPEEAMLLLVCPMCGMKDLRVPGHAKTFQWQLCPPTPVPVPGNPDAMQTLLLTILEPCGCPGCGQKFKIMSNVIYKG